MFRPQKGSMALAGHLGLQVRKQTDLKTRGNMSPVTDRILPGVITRMALEK